MIDLSQATQLVKWQEGNLNPGLVDPKVPALPLTPYRRDKGTCTSGGARLQTLVVGLATDPSLGLVHS